MFILHVSEIRKKLWKFQTNVHFVSSKSPPNFQISQFFTKRDPKMSFFTLALSKIWKKKYKKNWGKLLLLRHWRFWRSCGYKGRCFWKRGYLANRIWSITILFGKIAYMCRFIQLWCHFINKMKKILIAKVYRTTKNNLKGKEVTIVKNNHFPLKMITLVSF